MGKFPFHGSRRTVKRVVSAALGLATLVVSISFLSKHDVFRAISAVVEVTDVSEPGVSLDFLLNRAGEEIHDEANNLVSGTTLDDQPSIINSGNNSPSTLFEAEHIADIDTNRLAETTEALEVTSTTTEPVDSEPVVTEPVVTEPVATDPVATEPVASEAPSTPTTTRPTTAAPTPTPRQTTTRPTTVRPTTARPTTARPTTARPTTVAATPTPRPTTTTRPTTTAPTPTPRPTTAAPTPTPRPTTTARPTTVAPTPTPRPTTVALTPTPVPTTTARPTTPAPTPTPVPTPVPTTTAAPTYQYSSQYRNDILYYTNLERTSRGLAPLSGANGAVNAAAQIRAEEIIISFSHTRPDGRKGMTALKDAGAGGYTYAGENLAYNYTGVHSAQDTVKMWMGSSGHKANILNPNMKTLGVGYVSYNGTAYISQLFIG